MGSRGSSPVRGRPFVPDGRATHDRARIAQVAAKLIAEHGIADWSLAKRKAARSLMLPDRVALPGDDEVAAALVEYHALFGGDAHAATLRAQREEALRWMRRLHEFAPLLTGGVAAGWATEHSDIRLELVANDAKLVELALLNAGVAYRAMHSDRDGAAELFVEVSSQRTALVGAGTCGRAATTTPRPSRQRGDPARCGSGRYAIR